MPLRLEHRSWIIDTLPLLFPLRGDFLELSVLPSHVTLLESNEWMMMESAFITSSSGVPRRLASVDWVEEVGGDEDKSFWAVGCRHDSRT